jgi:hypothetical protein
MPRKIARRSIVRSADELPPGYVRMARWLERGRRTPAYAALWAAVNAGRLDAAKLHPGGRESLRGPVYVDEAAALRLLASTVEAEHTKPAASLFPVADDRQPLEPVATVAASLAAGDPGTVDRLAASLERVAEALEELLRRSRVELDLGPLA